MSLASAKQQFEQTPWKLRDGILLVVFYIVASLAVVGLADWLIGFYPNLIEGFEKAHPVRFKILLEELPALLAGLMALGLIAWLRRANLRDFGFHRFNWLKAIGTIIGLYVGAIAVVFVAITLATFLLPGINWNEEQQGVSRAVDSSTLVWALISNALIPPIIEELQFRGVVLPAIARRAPMWVAVLVSSLLFGLAHLQPGIILFAFIIGLFLAWIRIYTGSIVPAILFHITVNTIATFILYGIDSGKL